MRNLSWKDVEGFSKREFAPPEEPDHKWDMHPTLLTHLVNMRENGLDRFNGEFRILVHANGGYSTDGHSKSSLHYGIEADTLNGIRLGRAVDFHCENFSENHKCWVIVNWIDQLMLLRESIGGDDEHFGVGLHPNWNQQGFHFDYRVGARGGAVWWSKDGKYKTYQPEYFGEAVMDCLNWEARKEFIDK
jgi:hypothetical protein